MATPEELLAGGAPQAPLFPNVGVGAPAQTGGLPGITSPVTPPAPVPQGPTPPVTPIEVEDNVNGWQAFLKQVSEDQALSQSLLYLGAKLTDPQGTGGFAQLASGLNDATALLKQLQTDAQTKAIAEEDRQREIATQGLQDIKTEAETKLTSAQTELAVAKTEAERRPAAPGKTTDKEKLAQSLVKEKLVPNIDQARILIEQGLKQTKEQFVLAGLKQAEIQAAIFGGLDDAARISTTKGLEKAYDSLENVRELEGIVGSADDLSNVLPKANAARKNAAFQQAKGIMQGLTIEQFDTMVADPEFNKQLRELGIDLDINEE